jgi:hypothetical protein
MLSRDKRSRGRHNKSWLNRGRLSKG